MAGGDKVRCGNPDCGADGLRREMRGSIGGTLLCVECWPMRNAVRFKTDPPSDQRPRYKCARPGCRQYSLPEESRFTRRGYCSAECELQDLEPGVMERRQ